jgi:hypothetical protein
MEQFVSAAVTAARTVRSGRPPARSSLNLDAVGIDGDIE